MTALQAPAADARASAQLAGDVAVLEALLATQVTAAERLGQGRNSRVYRIRCDGQEYAAKFYYGFTADGRDRLAVEFAALDFLWKCGIRCIPRPVRSYPARQVGLYQCVAGEPMDARRAGPREIDQLLEFVADLRRLAQVPASPALPPAAEACFTIPDVVHNLRSRLAQLEALREEGPAYAALRQFLTRELRPALEAFAAQAEATRLGVLDQRFRTLSPSDLGFHNALRQMDGRVIFLDFEYFGWDDPVKMLCDAELHPRMQLPVEQRRRMALGFDRVFGDDPQWRRRIDVLYPLFALKWCLIILNEFRPEHIARRRYVDGAQAEVAALQLLQLDAARAMLAGLLERRGRFPYWEDNG
jgi:hypothetical protein